MKPIIKNDGWKRTCFCKLSIIASTSVFTFSLVGSNFTRMFTYSSFLFSSSFICLSFKEVMRSWQPVNIFCVSLFPIDWKKNRFHNGCKTYCHIHILYLITFSWAHWFGLLNLVCTADFDTQSYSLHSNLLNSSSRSRFTTGALFSRIPSASFAERKNTCSFASSSVLHIFSSLNKKCTARSRCCLFSWFTCIA